MSDTQPSTQQEQLELFLARRQAHQGRSSLLIKCAEAWHWAALSIPFIYTVAVLRHVLHCDVIHHTLSHITARHLITRSRAAKFQTSTSRSSFECLTLSQSQILMNSGTLTSTSSQEQHNYFLYICTQTQNDKKLRFALQAKIFGHSNRMVCTLSSKMQA